MQYTAQHSQNMTLKMVWVQSMQLMSSHTLLVHCSYTACTLHFGLGDPLYSPTSYYNTRKDRCKPHAFVPYLFLWKRAWNAMGLDQTACLETAFCILLSVNTNDQWTPTIIVRQHNQGASMRYRPDFVSLKSFVSMVSAAEHDSPVCLSSDSVFILAENVN